MSRTQTLDLFAILHRSLFLPFFSFSFIGLLASLQSFFSAERELAHFSGGRKFLPEKNTRQIAKFCYRFKRFICMQLADLFKLSKMRRVCKDLFLLNPLLIKLSD